jgi:FkbM family methyltransferase
MNLLGYVAQKLLAIELASPRPWAYRAVPHALRQAARDFMVVLGDPLVQFDLEGSRIRLPLSHDLPFNRARLPHYSSNIGRIARHAASKYPDLSVIDIGANVGDTAAIIHGHVRVPILCIEGHPQFVPLLRANLADNAIDSEIADTFVGDVDGEVPGRAERTLGTSRVVPDDGGKRTRMKTLRSILGEHPRFSRAKLIKIDTDGFDCQIILSDLAMIAEIKPILFFEYDPHVFAGKAPDGFTVFEALEQVGYQRFIFYHNEGDLLLTVDSKEHAIIEDLDAYFRCRGSRIYCDVCAFHEVDADLCSAIRQSELSFFRSHRSCACGCNLPPET